jgi:phosphopantothenoylcysteine synthetase/decarboxylase
MIANPVGSSDVGMGSDDNKVTVLWQDQQKDFAKMSKQKLARELVALIAINGFPEQK